MRVLLTGGNGFVGSHILDTLRASGVEVCLLLRRGSDRRFIARHLDAVAIQEGAITEPSSLDRALEGATHVIHCAGATRALSERQFFEINEGGTRNVVEAIRRHGGIQRLVHISSLAAVGGALRGRVLTEGDPECPSSAYGRSKRAADVQVRERCSTEYAILRPPAVYGPRDAEFLRLFKAVRRGFKPVFGDGGQELSFSYVADLAQAAVVCLTSAGAVRRTYFVAGSERVTSREFGSLVADVAQCRARLLRIPTWVLFPLCLGQDAVSQLTGRASVLSRHKFGEFRAEALTCDPSPLARDTGFHSGTNLRTGLRKTLEWYQGQGWI